MLNDDEIDARVASLIGLWLRALSSVFRKTGLPLEQQKNAPVMYHQALLKSRYPDLWERHLANSTTRSAADSHFEWQNLASDRELTAFGILPPADPKD